MFASIRAVIREVQFLAVNANAISNGIRAVSSDLVSTRTLIELNLSKSCKLLKILSALAYIFLFIKFTNISKLVTYSGNIILAYLC